MANSVTPEPFDRNRPLYQVVFPYVGIDTQTEWYVVADNNGLDYVSDRERALTRLLVGDPPWWPVDRTFVRGYADWALEFWLTARTNRVATIYAARP